MFNLNIAILEAENHARQHHLLRVRSFPVEVLLQANPTGALRAKTMVSEFAKIR